uniref:SSD domain-containing protein n=1 Tax=Meloidogyne enterolobii TaxID=390850 RepID=A0A6V7VYD1_MELEN|nr:unnamed protein product [Meloidogyne enterolobii]
MPIMPFLVFGIGVDNAFLLIHSWRKWALIEQRELNENKENNQRIDTFAQRMSNVFGEMGSSIAITSLTNGIAFGVGIFSPSSLMSNFCLCTSIAIFLDFLFEFLIFAPCLPFIKWKIEENENSLKRENWPLFGIIKLKKERSSSSFSSSFLRFYSKFLVSFRAKISIFVLLFVSYILAYFGINQMETSFIPERTFPGDSPLQDTIKIFNRIMKYHSPISFFVFHPPNISDPVELNNFNKMINIIQNFPNTLHVQIWLNGYLEYHKTKINLNNSINYQPNYSLVPQFLKERRMDDKRIVQFRDFGLGNISVDSFVFGISRGGDLNWLERAFFVDKIRNIVDQFPKFNVSVFDYDSTIYDLILGVKTEMLKAVFVTLTCMALICFFVIPTLRCTGIATFSVLSISYTLLGTLGWCGQDIDPVTMINLLMAIGLSVDFSAHICYHFDILQEKQIEIQIESPIKNIKIFEQKEIEKRIEQILEVVGRPMLEAVISTIICIFPLFFISIEIIASFARTVLFLGIIGTIHGLFIVPVLLTIQINGLNRNKASGFSEGNL